MRAVRGIAGSILENTMSITIWAMAYTAMIVYMYCAATQVIEMAATPTPAINAKIVDRLISFSFKLRTINMIVVVVSKRTNESWS